MKKLLIVNNNLHIGGVQRALVDLLKEIHDRYEITLVLFHPEGALLDGVPQDVKILPVRSAYRYLGMTKYDVAHKPLAKLCRGFYAAVCRVFGRNCAIGLMSLGQKQLKGFDAAISYLHDAGDKVFYGGCNDFVLRHVQAQKKITFLHCDYAGCGANTQKNKNRYKEFDRIAACSVGCADSFAAEIPQLLKKVVVVSNCQDYNSIRRKASKHALTLPEDRINVLTVARFGKEKGVVRGIEAFAHLCASCKDWHYYIIGDGALRPQIEDAIVCNGLQDRVTLLGEMENPYGYMQAADLLLIPSLTEAAPLVIGEAACLGTPILSTRTSSAKEMIEQTGYGWVCENSVEQLALALEQRLSAPEELKQKRQHLQMLQIDNAKAVAQFSALL